jgi:ribosomal protein L31E
MTINLRKRLLRLHSSNRRSRAVGMLREDIAKFTKSDIGSVRLNDDLNKMIERNSGGATVLLSRLKVQIVKSEDKVEVKLPQTAAEAAKTNPKTETKEKGKKVEEKSKQQKKA